MTAKGKAVDLVALAAWLRKRIATIRERSMTLAASTEHGVTEAEALAIAALIEAATHLLTTSPCSDPDCCKAAIEHDAATKRLSAALRGEHGE